MEFFCSRFGVDDFVDCVEGCKGGLYIRQCSKHLRIESYTYHVVYRVSYSLIHVNPRLFVIVTTFNARR